MANPAPTINQINAFNATQGTTIDFNIIGGTELVRSNRIYIYDLSDNSLICTHLYVSTESIHELPANTDSSIVYESGKSSADFVNGAQYYAQIQTFTDTAGTQGGSGLSVAKMFWCLVDPTLTIDTIPSTISTTSYNVSATYNANTSVVSNIIQQYQFSLYSATGSLLQSSGVVVGSGTQQGTSTAYDISYNFTGLSVGSSYYVVVDVTTTQGMSVSVQSSTFTVSIDTPTLGEATVVNNACDGYISVTSNLSGEYGGSGSGEIVSFVTDSVNDVSSLKVTLTPQQDATPWIGTDHDTTPYLHRAMPTQSNAYNRESGVIVGGTVAWNQQAEISSSSKTITRNGITATDNRDGSYTLNGTASAFTTISLVIEKSWLPNHKYIFWGCPHNGSASTYQLRMRGAGGDTADSGEGALWNPGTTTWKGMSAVIQEGTTLNNLVFKPQIIDLTAMFGSTIADAIYAMEQATAGAGVAWCKQYEMFRKYTPYNNGELMSVKALSHVTSGKNLLDTSGMSTAGQSQVTFARTADGVITVGGKAVANVYRVIETFQTIKDVQYTLTGTPSGGASGKYRMTVGGYGYDYGDGYTFTGDGEAHAISIDVYTGYPQSGTLTFKPMIRFASVSDATFEPYSAHTYPLPNVELRGIPKWANGKLSYDGDILEPSGRLTRKYGIVDLGTLNWSYNSGPLLFYTGINDAVKSANTGLHGVCSKYRCVVGYNPTGGINDTTQDKVFSIGSSFITVGNNLLIRDTAYTDPEQFKTAMSGVYLVYELATPTTETADPYTNPQVVDPDGTEEYVTANSVPVGHDSTYSLVCPISGYDEVSANVVGKNLVDWVITEHTFETAYNGFGQGKWQNKMPIPNLWYGKTITYSAYIRAGSNGSQRVRVWFYKDGVYVPSYVNGSAISENQSGISYATITIPDDGSVNEIAFGLSVSGSTVSNPQVELGSTATEYEPYTKQTVSQEFDVSLTPTSKDTDPYLFKAVGDIYGDRLEEDIVGGTVAWNQLVENTGKTTQTINGVTFTVLADGRVKVNGTATADARYDYNRVDFIAGHKYLSYGIPSGASISTHFAYITGAVTKNTIYMYSQNDYWGVRILVKSGATVDNVIYSPMCTDLTQMFGSTIADYVYSLEQATAGSGIAWLKSYGFFTKPYYEYDAGTLKSVEGLQSHDTVGFNLLDIATTYRDDYFALNNGKLTNTSTDSRATIQVVLQIYNNTTWVANIAQTGWASTGKKQVLFNSGNYEATELRIKHNGSSRDLPILRVPYNLLMKDTDYCLSFDLISNNPTAVGGLILGDICINLSKTTGTPKNGDYVPYVKHTYALDSDLVLRGIPELDASNNLYYDGDTYASDGTVTRKRAIRNTSTFTTSDMSNLRVGDNTVCVYIEMTLMKPNASTTEINILADKLKCYAPDYIYSNDVEGISENRNANRNGFWIRIAKSKLASNDYTGMASYFTSNPVNVLYELKTPTTETADPFENIQEVSKYGTLEYITSNDVPVGHNTTYLTRDVFSGYIDLVSGQLVVDRIIDIRNTADMDNNEQFPGWKDSVFNEYFGNGKNVLINAPLNIGSSYGLNTVAQIGAIWLPTNIYGKTQTEWIAMAMDVQITIPLATPQTYQLTPQQIQTLVGVNNVWSEQGDVELSYHIPITNLLVKRQDVDDVSGDWLTLYSQPITQASDMDFTFIDFTNQYGKTYKYALVPLLTQTQSGVEVEVEGGYTVSDEVQSVFDGVFIADSTGSQKCKANVGYGDVNMNQSVGSITPIGSQYPIIVTNSNNRYHNGSISGMIVPDDYYYNGNLSRIDMVNKRNELEKFLTNKRAKIIKDWNSNIWLVMIMDNIDCSFDNNYGMGIVTFNANWLEVGDPTNQEDLQATGLVNVGGV